MRLEAGLCPDPLGKLERSPRPPIRNWGEGVPTSTGEGTEGMGKGKEGARKGREKGKEREETGGDGGLTMYAFP